MTETEWLACGEPERMLAFAGASDERRLKLLAAACCRCVWPLLLFDASRQSVEVVERFADGFEEDRELGETGVAAYNAELCIEAVVRPPSSYDVDEHEEEVCRRAIQSSALPGGAVLAAARAASALCDSSIIRWAVPGILRDTETAWSLARGPQQDHANQEASGAMRAEQTRLLRDIFGNPFRPVTADPSWFTSTVVTLAEGIYADRAFDRLPILADALQDAGCDSDDILTHCRGPGPHVRGCWVVDLVLGKE